MAFTFNLSQTGNLLIISKIRLNTGDKVENEGILPKGTNFQDDEILSLYTDEGSHLQRASAAVMEAAAARWSAYAGRYGLGPENEEFYQAQEFRKQAAELRQRYGFTTDDTTADAGAGMAINLMPSGK